MTEGKVESGLRDRVERIVYRCPTCGWIEGPKPDWPCPGYAGEEHPAEPFRELSVTPTADVRELVEAAQNVMAKWQQPPRGMNNSPTAVALWKLEEALAKHPTWGEREE